MSNYGFGLGIFPKLFRIPIAVSIIILIQFIPTLELSIICLISSVLLLFANPKIYYPKLLIIAISTTWVILFVGNALFSEPSCGGYSFWVFKVNGCGVIQGTINGNKRTAQLIFGFAGIGAFKFYELPEIILSYLNIFTKSNSLKRLVSVAVSLFPKLAYELQNVEYSLAARTLRTSRKPLKEKIQIKLIKLGAVVLRIFYNIQRIAYLGESHFNFTQNISSYFIKLRNVFAYYSSDQLPVLSNINVDINEGEIIFLSGCRGAGKTTLLKLIGGYIPNISGNASGEMNIGDIDWLSDSTSLENKLSVARYLSQELTDNIIGVSVKQEIMSYSKDEDQSLAVLKDLGIDHLWNSECLRLSGGEKIRLIIACLIVSKIKIVLFDNLLASIDKSGRHKAAESIVAFIKKSKATLIISDPYAPLLGRAINRIIRLDSGQVNIDTTITSENYQLLLDYSEIDYHFWRKGMVSFEPKCNNNESSLICKVDSMNVSYNNCPVIIDFSLEVNKGEFIVIVGENGSGKTTAMLALCNLIKHDFEIEKSMRNEGHIGFSFQSPNTQIVQQSIYEELTLSTRLKNIEEPKSSDYVAKEIAWLDINEDQSIFELHDTLMRFVSISMMNCDTNLMILDEPTVGLQSEDTEKLLKWIEKYIYAGNSIIMVTHDEYIAQNASRIVKLNNGKIGFDTRSIVNCTK